MSPCHCLTSAWLAIGKFDLNSVRKRVLICDDEPHICESIQYVVEKEGHEAMVAYDGLQANQMALNERPDLAILDVGMSGMTGFQLCEKLRSTAELSEMKIIILTAFGQVTDEQKAYQVGADRFLKKPFSPRVLREILQELLE